ncbi:gliding motility protein GldC [Putridiphycobacter roseus]|uniref:Gliding motility protein GldC n=1 Tax=Putridiphycobacter roseus TaxID=2219161 RepID=A0A2W1NEF1_9FLAO|nr:gliding motility protein GldC [Putridiphycobacter roseus]PZE16446.1 gliding motility protein GldC [Putridiphycobacter roseus]
MDKSSQIKIDINTNENNVPKTMHWSAEDGGVEGAEAKAMILSLWDKKQQNAMRIDLWTEEMTVDEMKQFFHQTLLTMADSFERATGEKNITEDLRDYCLHFADKMDIMPPLS